MRWLREFRLIPLALVGVASLLALKVAGLLLDGGYTLGQRLNRGDNIVVTTVPASSAAKLRTEAVPLDLAHAQPAGTRPWAQEMFNYPDVTGSVPAAKPAAEAKPNKPAEPPAGKPPETRPAANAPAASPPAAEPPKPVSAAERAVLERLQERRQQLEARTRELDMREALLKAAEQKFDRPGADPKDQTAQPQPPSQDAPELGRFKNLVTMYEAMKPKDAAKIFDRLDIKVLLEVSSLINPRKMSEILAAMTPEAAERLTVEWASRARNPNRPPSPSDLPKIEGKPTGG